MFYAADKDNWMGEKYTFEVRLLLIIKNYLSSPVTQTQNLPSKRYKRWQWRGKVYT